MRSWQKSLGLVKPCHSLFPSKKQDSGLGASRASASQESPQPRRLPEQSPRSRRSGRGSMGWWWSGGPRCLLALSGGTLGCRRVWRVSRPSWAVVLHHLLVAATAALPRVPEPRAEVVNVITGCTFYPYFTAICLTPTFTDVLGGRGELYKFLSYLITFLYTPMFYLVFWCLIKMHNEYNKWKL